MPRATRAEILDNVGYEWWMYRVGHEAVKELSAEMPVNTGRRNLALEAWLLHGRNLVEFFYRDRGVADHRVRADDWVVGDVCGLMAPGISTDPEVQKIIRQINKRVGHLTDMRMSKEEWHVHVLYRKLAEKVSQLRTALGAEFPASWQGDAEAR